MSCRPQIPVYTTDLIRQAENIRSLRRKHESKSTAISAVDGVPAVPRSFPSHCKTKTLAVSWRRQPRRCPHVETSPAHRGRRAEWIGQLGIGQLGIAPRRVKLHIKADKSKRTRNRINPFACERWSVEARFSVSSADRTESGRSTAGYCVPLACFRTPPSTAQSLGGRRPVTACPSPASGPRRRQHRVWAVDGRLLRAPPRLLSGPRRRRHRVWAVDGRYCVPLACFRTPPPRRHRVWRSTAGYCVLLSRLLPDPAVDGTESGRSTAGYCVLLACFPDPAVDGTESGRSTAGYCVPPPACSPGPRRRRHRVWAVDGRLLRAPPRLLSGPRRRRHRVWAVDGRLLRAPRLLPDPAVDGTESGRSTAGYCVFLSVLCLALDPPLPTAQTLGRRYVYQAFLRAGAWGCLGRSQIEGEQGRNYGMYFGQGVKRCSGSATRRRDQSLCSATKRHRPASSTAAELYCCDIRWRCEGHNEAGQAPLHG